jgi:hypothetical protein
LLCDGGRTFLVSRMQERRTQFHAGGQLRADTALAWMRAFRGKAAWAAYPVRQKLLRLFDRRHHAACLPAGQPWKGGSRALPPLTDPRPRPAGHWTIRWPADAAQKSCLSWHIHQSWVRWRHGPVPGIAAVGRHGTAKAPRPEVWGPRRLA